MDLVATVSPTMPTVVDVTWTSATPTVGRVDGATLVEAPPAEAEATTEHHVRVLGLRAETAVTLDVWEDDVRVGGVTVTTGALPDEVWAFEDFAPSDALPDVRWLLYAAVKFDDTGLFRATAAILDREGQPVWGVVLDDLFPMMPIWDPAYGLRSLSTDFLDYGNSTLDGWDVEGGRATTPMPQAHHEAVWLPDGTVGMTVTVSREVDGELVGGDVLVERAPDGTETVVWDAFEALSVVQNDGWFLGKLADGAADWTHANSLRYLPEDDAWLVSLYYPECVVLVDRATGATRWILGGVDGTFEEGPDAGFGPQHSAALVGGQLLLYDNNTPSNGSRILGLEVDPDARTSTLAWAWEPSPPIWNVLLGHLEPAGADGWIAAWGTVPAIYLLDADREVVGHYQLTDPDFAGALGAARVVPSLY